MIKQILFDCGGVLATLDFQTVMTEVTGDPALGALLVERLWTKNSPWHDYDKGHTAKEKMPELLAAFIPEISVTYFKDFMERWPATMTPIPGMEHIVQELHQLGFPCYLLSNFNPQFEELRSFHPNIRELDGEVVSYNIDMLKPDRKIFDYAARSLGIDPAVTLFIDDSLDNVKSAIAAGYQGYHFTDAKAFRQRLREMNILTK